jgi:hypothetical protein
VSSALVEGGIVNIVSCSNWVAHGSDFRPYDT